MTAVVLAGAGGVESLVVELAKALAAGLVCPYPFLKRLLDQLLLALRNCCFLFVEDGSALAVRLDQTIEDADGTQVQRFLM